MHILRGDSLSFAIQKSDVISVRSLLKERKLTEQEKTKYLNTADQIIRFRNDCLILDKHDYKPNRATTIWFCTFIISSIIALKTEFPSAIGIAVISFFGIIVSGMDNPQTNYYNAIAIKETLYDSECTALQNT